MAGNHIQENATATTDTHNLRISIDNHDVESGNTAEPEKAVVLHNESGLLNVVKYLNPLYFVNSFTYFIFSFLGLGRQKKANQDVAAEAGHLSDTADGAYEHVAESTQALEDVQKTIDNDSQPSVDVAVPQVVESIEKESTIVESQANDAVDHIIDPQLERQDSLLEDVKTKPKDADYVTDFKNDQVMRIIEDITGGKLEKAETDSVPEETLKTEVSLSTLNDTQEDLAPPQPRSEDAVTSEEDTCDTSNKEDVVDTIEVNTSSEAEVVTSPEVEVSITPEAEIVTNPEAVVSVNAEAEIVTSPEVEVSITPEAEVVTSSEAVVSVNAEAEIVTRPEAETVTSAEAAVVTSSEAEIVTSPEIGQTEAAETVEQKVQAPSNKKKSAGKKKSKKKRNV
ncbi:S-antigen protein [Zancudomyces culisetae]|uniref:S-antigen protein n=1 Tax=Zancudomyces culisetae TaxID=1213189 RepID=A0A1R1PXV9_ZANCU|nr:S-antigen protein [Zancudomyces culisetae]|eukprot:OMH85752.1 S-antigen protein [Zancudomyces culisetae]